MEYKQHRCCSLYCLYQEHAIWLVFTPSLGNLHKIRFFSRLLENGEEKLPELRLTLPHAVEIERERNRETKKPARSCPRLVPPLKCKEKKKSINRERESERRICDGWVTGEEKRASSAMGSRERDRELLIPVAEDPADDSDSKASTSSSAATHHHSGREAFCKVIRSWASKKFMSGCVILFPLVITFYITWWFIHFVDGFFSPIYAQLGINIFGLGFITSLTFIFLVGVFMSSWLGASVLSLSEWFIKRMPFVRHIYDASKQISAAMSPDQNKQAFKEVAIIRHPRNGEYAFGFITSAVVLQNYSDEEELCCVYVPTNHVYIGDIFLVSSKDVIRPNLSVHEGIEIVVSGGMSMPQILSMLDSRTSQVHRTRSGRH